MNLIFKVLKTNEEIKSSYVVMKELRPHLTQSDYLEFVLQAMKQDQYELQAVYHQQNLVGLIGHRILTDLVHGPHLYVDDLIVTESMRSQKIGHELLKLAEDRARLHHLKTLRLCTGIDNEKGKNFYQKENWNLRAVVYKKKLN